MNPSPLSRPLTRRVTSFLVQHGLGNDKGPLVVGVSGGPDSVCLLDVLSQVRPSHGVTLHAAHLDHRLRGDESAADARYVADLCKRLDVPLTVESADVGQHRRRRRLSLEEAGRECRLRFFTAVAEKMGAQAVLLAHTADDQAETVLMHILRGSGMAGLRGMEPLARWKGRGGYPLVLGRPLLTTWRRETQAYCAEHGLSPRLDASNLSLEFARNRLRLEVLPLLRRLNPKVDEALLRLADRAGETAEFLDSQAQKAWRRMVRRTPEGLAIQRGRLLALHPAVAAHLLRRALQEVRGDLQGITSAHIHHMLGIAAGPTGKEARLPGGLVFRAGYGLLQLGARPQAAEGAGAIEGEWPVRVPGMTEIPGWEIRVRVVPYEVGALREPVPRPLDTLTEFLDGELAARTLWVRSRLPGDRFQPLGLPGPKKLQDFFVDAKAPRAIRDQVPLLCDRDGILWVVGYRVAQRARVKPGGRAILRVEFAPASGRP